MISNTQIGKRLRAIHSHWKKGKSKKEQSMQVFADTLGVHRTTVSVIMNGKAQITIEAMDGVHELGYSLEWLLFRDGKMKPDEKVLTGFIDAKVLQDSVDALRIQIRLKDARLIGIEKELEDLKEDVLTLRSMLTRLAPTDKPLTNTKHIS